MSTWKYRIGIGAILAVSVGLLASGMDARVRGLMGTTLQLLLAVAVGAVPSGILLAVLIFRTNVFGRRSAMFLLTAMLFVPLYLQAAGWDAGFGRQGWFSLAGESFTQPWLSGLRGAIWVHLLAAIPWVTIFVGIALQQIDPELEESALLDCGLPKVLWRVTVPLVLPAVAAAMLWVSIVTAGEIAVTDLYQVRTFAEEVYTNAAFLQDPSSDDPSSATLPGGTGLLFTFLVVGLLAAATIVRQPISTPTRQALQFELGIGRIPATVVLVVAAVVIAGVPLGNLAYNLGLRLELSSGQITRGWSAAKAASLLWATPRRFASELAWSAAIGAASATVCAVLAFPLAWSARRRGWRSWPALACVAVGAALPGPILGLWIIRACNQPNIDWLTWLYDHSLFAPVVATCVRAIPAAILVTWYGMQSLSQDLVDLAAVDGLGPAQRLLRVILPLRWQVLLAAWLVSFVVAAGDLSASILVTPPGLSTTPVRVFGLLHAGVDDQVAGLCLTNLATLVAIQSGVVWLIGRSRRVA